MTTAVTVHADAASQLFEILRRQRETRGLLWEDDPNRVQIDDRWHGLDGRPLARNGGSAKHFEACYPDRNRRQGYRQHYVSSVEEGETWLLDQFALEIISATLGR